MSMRKYAYEIVRALITLVVIAFFLAIAIWVY